MSGGVLVCMVLTAGALFGMAAQTVLGHFGLDLVGVRDNLIIGRVAQSRSALAWWAWWLLPVGSFLVGPLSVAVIRSVAAHWWLLRGLRLLASAVVVLGLAAIGHLAAARSPLDIGAGTALGALVALLSASLAAAGARSVGVAARKRAYLPGLEYRRIRTFDPVPTPDPQRGGGSVDSGMAARRFRRSHSLVPGFRPHGRLSFAAVLALVILAAVSAVSGAAVMLELIAPGTIGEVLSSAPPPPKAVAIAARSAQESSGSRPRALIPMSASEYTFAKGYAKRHVAQLAAELVTAALRADIQMPVTLEGRNIAVINIERMDSTHGRSARARSHRGGATRYAATSRHAAASRHASHGHVADRADRRRYAGGEWYGGHNRYRAYDRYRSEERYSRHAYGYRFADF